MLSFFCGGSGGQPHTGETLVVIHQRPMTSLLLVMSQDSLLDIFQEDFVTMRYFSNYI